MLLGEFHCIADSSGKLSMPIEFTTKLDDGLTLTRGIDRCLFVYPAEEWHRLAERVQGRLPLTSAAARAFARLMFSSALACTPDDKGRIPLPNSLRQYAGIEGEAIVIGLYNHLEIWNPQRWQEVSERMVEEGARVVERLSHLEI